MQPKVRTDRLAVCSWSLQPKDIRALAAHLENLQIPRVQIALDPIREDESQWGDTAAVLAERGITAVSGMFGTIGEDYSTLESIQRTGGIVPDQHWPANWERIQMAAILAQRLSLKLVGFHAGFLPHEEDHPDYAKLFDRISRISDLFAEKGIELAFETGQETADTLGHFLTKLNRPNVGVNFDPANMLLYDKGDPIEALNKLGTWLKQCHIKDATRTKVPGTWGTEVVVGTGEVDWSAFFDTLAKLDFDGYLCIEREAGDQREADIHTAKEYLEGLG